MKQIDDDFLVHEFIKTNKQEFEDRGFSQRVMRRLPDRAQKLARIWVAICSVAAIGIFILVDGFSVLGNVLSETMDSLGSKIMSLDYNTLIITVVVLVGLGVGRILSTET